MSHALHSGAPAHRAFARFAWGVLVFNLAVIAWGAFVRASGSGAGCGEHWPLCNGEVLPQDPAIETMIELTHRVTSGLALLVVLAMFVWALRALPRAHPARSMASASMFFMIIELLVGAALVLLALVGQSQSPWRAVVMAVHLVNTFILIATIALSAHHAGGARGIDWRAKRGAAGALSCGVLLLIVTGVTGAIAALGDTLFPSASLSEGLEADVAQGAHLLVRLRVLHPFVAVFSGLYVALTAGLIAMQEATPRARRDAALLGALVLAQLGGGLVDLLLLAPTWMQLVHLIMANLVWIGTVLFSARILARPA